MLRVLKAAILSTFLLVIVAVGILKFDALHIAGASQQAGPRALVLASTAVAVNKFKGNAYADGPYTVQGNAIIGANGKRYLFHGIGRDSLEYSCWGDGHFDAQELAYMGSGTNKYAVTYWGANTVRLPLSEGIWLNGQSSQSCTATQYQALVKQTVDTLTALHLNVILDLQWSDAGGQASQAGGPWAAPDADSVTFWRQVASIYKSYPYNATDGRENDDDTTSPRVFRGGWLSYQDGGVSSIMRVRQKPDERDWHISFRCARSA